MRSLMTHSSPLRTIEDSYRKQKATHEYKREFSPTNKDETKPFMATYSRRRLHDKHKQINKQTDRHTLSISNGHCTVLRCRGKQHNRGPYWFCSFIKLFRWFLFLFEVNPPQKSSLPSRSRSFIQLTPQSMHTTSTTTSCLTVSSIFPFELF